MFNFIIFGLVYFNSCNSASQIKTEVDNIEIRSYKILIDNFLNDKSISRLSKDLYFDKVKPTDSFENIALIDSINSVGQARSFYFLAITKLMKYADGAYSEALGIATKAYVEDNTIEFLSYFIENEDLLTNEDFKNWTRLVFGEIRISSEGSEQIALTELKVKMVTNCQGLSPEYQYRIEKFFEDMK